MGSLFSLGKSSNDTQENPKDAQKSTSFQEKYTKPTETTELVEKNKVLTTEKENLTKDKENLTKDKAELQKQVKDLQDSQQVLENENAELSKEKENLTKEKTDLTEKNKNLTTEKNELTNKITGLSAEKDNLTNQLNASQKQVKELQDSKQVLENEKTELSKDKENLTKEKSELEQKHAPYEKLEKLYEVFLEVKDRLNFNFVATTHSAMDLIASVLSDSKYYLESLYNKASQELSDKRSDKGEKLAELFDLLFEYIKDSKFERLKEPSAYDHSCKTLYPEQNASQKMQRVVLRGYTYDKKIACHTIVDMGS
ncbi:hypothetical protein KVM77_00285 [Helicobacter pylori]|nr:hypothetical protein KVM77_00285 [Helicobacter pylori]